MSADGCQQCGLDQYSAAGATSCTPCPEGLLSLRGSVSVDDCYNGECRVFTEIVVFSSPRQQILLSFVICYKVISFIKNMALCFIYRFMSGAF